MPDPALVELQAEHERRLRRIGLEPETRKFTPHVTLARLRGVKPRAVADYLAARGGLAVDGFIAERFVLFSSRDSVGGGPYVVGGGLPAGVEARAQGLAVPRSGALRWQGTVA